MSSRRGNGKPSVPGTCEGSSSKGKNVPEVSGPKVEQLVQGIAHVNLDSVQDGGEWEVYARKSKNRAGSSAAKQWGSQNPNPKAWGNQNAFEKQGAWNNPGLGRTSGNAWPAQTPDSKRPAGRGVGRPQIGVRGYESSYVAPQPIVQPPLEHGWNWKSRPAATLFKDSESSQDKVESLSDYHPDDVEKDDDVDEDDDSDILDDTDDEFPSDDFDSDSSQQSHDTRKKSKWFKKFFEILEGLSAEEISDPERQWHCPACQGGPGAIDWYRGLQPLMTHAKTKGSKRVKVHRDLAELLDEELRRMGASVVPAGEVFGQWKGLKEGEKDHDIIWPPMVVIMNTQLEQEESGKWIGMGNQELLDYFSTFAAVKARHSYGPQGHRGISVLIFESSARGYLEAERLHKYFTDQGTDRYAWEHRRTRFLPGGKRQLYGFLATKEDLDFFNQHSQGKSKLKYELRSYQEMYVNQIRQMSEDNQQLIWLKNKVVKEQRNAKALEESFNMVSEKLRKTMEENRIVRQRTKMQHEQNKEEMDFQEDFFKNQIKIIHDARDAKEENFEMQQQEKREKLKQLNANPSNAEEYRQRLEEVRKSIQLQDEEVENFVTERDELLKRHEDSLAAMIKRHWEEKLELEAQFNAELDRLMEKYSPRRAVDRS